MDRPPVAPADVLREPDLDDMAMGFSEFRVELRRAFRRQTWTICGAVVATFSLSGVIRRLA